MNKEEIVRIVTKYVDQALQGQKIENPKLDFKKEWYDLKSKPGINEFLKDTSAIVNTFGPDGYLIIGVDEVNRTQEEVSFKDSQLKEQNELNGIINKRVDRAFDLTYFEEKINEKIVGIVHLPPSLDKPHVIKNYQTFHKDGTIKREESHRVFVRSGTNTRIATKYDLELMIYDRKNIHPDYILNIYVNNIRFVDTAQNRPTALCTINIENTGKRPASIKELNLIITIGNSNNDFKFIDADMEFEINNRTSYVKLHSRNLIIKSNDVIQKGMRFFYPEEGIKGVSGHLGKSISRIDNIEAQVILNNGKEIWSQCELLFI